MVSEIWTSLIEADPEQSGLDVDALEAAAREYPWSAYVQLLLAKRYRLDGHPAFADQLKRASMCSPDREALYRFLNPDPATDTAVREAEEALPFVAAGETQQETTQAVEDMQPEPPKDVIHDVDATLEAAQEEVVGLGATDQDLDRADQATEVEGPDEGIDSGPVEAHSLGEFSGTPEWENVLDIEAESSPEEALSEPIDERDDSETMAAEAVEETTQEGVVAVEPEAEDMSEETDAPEEPAATEDATEPQEAAEPELEDTREEAMQAEEEIGIIQEVADEPSLPAEEIHHDAIEEHPEYLLGDSASAALLRTVSAIRLDEEPPDPPTHEPVPQELGVSDSGGDGPIAAEATDEGIRGADGDGVSEAPRDPDAKKSFGDWLQTMAGTASVFGEEEADAEPTESPGPPEAEMDTVAAISHPGPVVEEVPEIELDEVTPEDVTQLAKKSIERDAGLVTETLAEVLVKQKKLAKAREAYEQLALLYPEKSDYFAGRLEAIKSLDK